MSLLAALRARLRAIVRPDDTERDLEEEIAFHIALETEKNVRLGFSPDEARRIALAHFGGIQRTREAHRDVRPLRWVADFAVDARIGLRLLARAPGLTAAAIVTIALGIGANAAIFSAVNAVLLRPLPFAQPDRLVMLADESPARGERRQFVSIVNMLDWREAVPAFTGIAAYDYGPSSETMTGQGEARRLRVADVTGNLFAVLGARAALGRTLTEDETWDTSPATIVLSHAAWMRDFAGDTGAVGRVVNLDAKPVRIVGVMPATFAFPYENLDGWISFRWDPASRANPLYRRVRWLRAIARVRSGVSLEAANSQLGGVAKRLARDYPEANAGTTTVATPLQSFLAGNTRLPLLVLLAGVTILLIIACANVGNLLLVRATGRHREMAVRLAIGAGWGRLTRQAVAESLVLSALGGATGLATAWAGARVLAVLQPDGLLGTHDVGVDARVVVYVAAITIVAALLFAVAPVIWIQRRDPAEALSGSRTAGESRRSRRWTDALVVSEVALALSMTVGAGLLVRTFVDLAHVDAGFDSRGVIAAGLNLGPFYDADTSVDAFTHELLSRARQLPGVTQAAFSGVLPLTGMVARTAFRVEGRDAAPSPFEVLRLGVSADYFATLRVPLRRGRLFSAAEDRRGGPPVVLINETFARSFFAGENPIGRRLTFIRGVNETGPFTIIGVVGDVRDSSLVDPAVSAVIRPSGQGTWWGGYLLVRTNGDSRALAGAVRELVRTIDPRIHVSTRPLDEVRGRALARPRYFAALLGAFAIIGLVLATVGVYAVLAQAGRNRAREMGIRVALGAQAHELQWLFVRHGLRLTGTGLLAGAIASLGATRGMRALLFGVAPYDPLTFTAVALLLAAAGMAATWIPAIRASRSDPVVVLRAE